MDVQRLIPTATVSDIDSLEIYDRDAIGKDNSDIASASTQSDAARLSRPENENYTQLMSTTRNLTVVLEHNIPMAEKPEQSDSQDVLVSSRPSCGLLEHSIVLVY